MRTARRTVLVTGGAGFIGSHLVGRLIEAGHRVCVLDDMSTGSPANLQPSGHLRIVEGDVRSKADVAAAAAGCDLTFHMAGVVGMRLAHHLANESWEIADIGTRNVLAATGSSPCVLMSSSCVYGLRRAGVCSEEDVVSDAEVLAYDGGKLGYSAGKLQLERHGIRAAAGGKPILIVRPFNVVGPRQSAVGRIWHGAAASDRTGASRRGPDGL